ncbi:Fe(3+)-hydroxamate ABC transporter permease FhuB [Aliihoeflea sp. 40Bstr573]|uniref:Fe(3+)-hydroxamate ABC transporter permease FhuB n=1 Tax=Aliihoeflea sp. 40Bstr573 TaxID=2696467 RepID=UPI002094D344|nr:Fe(3+)-hydroxamate ABC transporter permease FhuB [Aliihoeflea sp. 40Bstr573]MCO6387361.1 Fe(3+)-hydroxamate ABC transporter permease FhuB [Aliihoeflea sp. 40Bstr573]
MTMRIVLCLAALVAATLIHLGISSPLPLATKWVLATSVAPDLFEEVRFYHSVLPRLAMALLAGAALGLSGAIMQEATQNRLASPMTLGVSAGARVGLYAATVFLPGLAAAYGEWFALAGASATMLLVLAIAGRQGIGGLPIVLAGMALNLLLSAVAVVLIIMNEFYVRHLFVWGAGDLTQIDWQGVSWLWPRLLLALPFALLLARPLTLLRLGEQGASARGVPIMQVLALALLVALWLTATVVAIVGVIGFIGLIAPNIARMAGARSTLDRLVTSIALGAALMVGTDAVALYGSNFTSDMIPSGATAALVGAPALVWLAASQMKARDHLRFFLPKGRDRMSVPALGLLALVTAGILAASFAVAVTGEGWRVEWPSELVFALRWPRIAASAAAGVAMAIAGVVLQRLIRNPLASPDIMGMTSGATLALVASAILAGGSIHDAGTGVAVLGSATVLGLLILFGRRADYAPGIMALAGISLAALLDAIVQFVIARGGEEAFAIVGWLSGSTYRVQADEAIFLAICAAAFLALGLLARRPLTLIIAGDTLAGSRGLSVPAARLGMLVFSATVTAAVTSVMGPIAFVGLISPHLASLLGARRAGHQLVAAALIGMSLLTVSDWLGRSVLYPAQLPAGTIAAIIGGSYFILLLARRPR